MDYLHKIENEIKGLGFDIISKDFQRPWGGFLVINEDQSQEFANHFFDGKPNDLEKFVKMAVVSGVFKGKTVVKDFGKMEKKYPKEFTSGYNYAKGFIKRHLEDT